MNNKKKGAIAALAGTALLVSGGSFALWSQTQDVTGGTVQAGQFGVNAKSMGFFDTSADRSDATTPTGITGDPSVVKGHAIDLTTWRAVPQDTILGVYEIDGKLEGDNLVAKLAVNKADGTPLAGANTAATDGYTVQYALADASGALQGGWVNTPADVKFTSADNKNNNAALPILDNNLDGQADYKVAVKVTFDANGTDHQQAPKDLTGLKVGLTQERVKDGQGGF